MNTVPAPNPIHAGTSEAIWNVASAAFVVLLSLAVIVLATRLFARGGR